MKEDQKKALKALVNSSGYLFQLAVENSVKKNRHEHEWEVISSEHPWVDVNSNSEGFIDLVLGRSGVRLVMECKRSLNADWVFLVPEDSAGPNYDIRCQWTSWKENKIHGDCDDIYMLPESPQSSFCAIRGSGEGDRSLLERMSGVLLKSADCLAQEESELSRSRVYRRHPSVMVYIPVIVTTAALKVCRFKLGDVSIADGKLSTAEFESVPIVRFRKSLVTQLTPNASPETMTDANRDKERTVLVISAPELSSFLKEISFERKDVGLFYQFPWDRKS